MMQELNKLIAYARERGFEILEVRPILHFDKLGVPEFDEKRGLMEEFPPEFTLLGVNIKMK